jgi:hypothetical protein
MRLNSGVQPRSIANKWLRCQFGAALYSSSAIILTASFIITTNPNVPPDNFPFENITLLI